MKKYVLRRLLVAIPTFLGTTLIVFVMSQLAPGGPMDQLTAGVEMTQEAYDALKASLGLDRPIIIQYLSWLSGFFHGDLGVSYRTNLSVMATISQRIGPTLLLTLTSMVISLLIAVPLGILIARHPYGKLDYLANGFSFLGQAVPNFLFSLVLMYLFGVYLNWLPITGMNSPDSTSLADTLRHIILPCSVLCWRQIAAYMRYTRSSMLEVFNLDYVKTARAKGISERRVILRHVFRNAVIPVITAVGMRVPALIGGTVVVEQIFGWPGVGSLMIDSISYRDYPVIMGITCMIAAVVLITNLVMDLIYAALDPRISYS